MRMDGMGVVKGVKKLKNIILTRERHTKHSLDVGNTQELHLK